jgi:hypothetical protein
VTKPGDDQIGGVVTHCCRIHSLSQTADHQIGRLFLAL